uniref:E3 ubiquitin-protein ligase listerin n=1 Tax=Syphacia muris TaxID=451379 RepID=A0A158R5P9_9BILA
MSKPQRRKGNAKTASSSRAAQLLTESGHNVPFISFSDFGFTTPNTSTFETELDEVDAEVRNALKKMRKKDYLTREKGLKELLSHIKILEQDQVSLSFMHYTAVFPLLIMDSLPSIRIMALQLLLEYIKLLKKGSEKYLKNVLPYVFFSLSDAYKNVSESAQLLLNNFSSQKKALEICIDSCVEMASNILNGTHPYLEKNEGNETDKQRISRISTQALNFLTYLVEQQQIKEGHSQQLVDFIQNKFFIQRLFDYSPQVASGLFALINQMCLSKWPGTVQKELLVIALKKLDSPNLQLCRFAAEYILLTFKSQKDVENTIFNEKFLIKTVVPNVVSFIRKKGSHWSNMGPQYINALLKMVLAEIPTAYRNELFLKIMNAFFESLSVFHVSSDFEVWVTCLNSFISYSFTPLFNETTNVQTSEVLELVLNNLTQLTDAPVELFNALVITFKKFCVQPKVHIEKALVLWRRFLLCLVERLPHTETAIINTLNGQEKFVWLQLCMMLLRHTDCTPELLIRIVDNFNNELLLELDKQISLMDEFAAKIDWQNEDVALHILAEMIKIFVIKSLNESNSLNFQEYFKLNNELACLRLMKAAEFIPDCREKLFKTTPMEVWEYVIENALQKSFEENTEVFLTIFKVSLDYPHVESLIMKFLNAFSIGKFDLLLAMARLLTKKGFQNVNKKVSELLLHSLICSPENCDSVSECAEELEKLNYEPDLIVQFIRNHLQNIEHRSFVLSILLSLVLQLERGFGLMMLITTDELANNLDRLDKHFGIYLLMNYEFISGNWKPFVKNEEDHLANFKDTTTYAVNESLFLLQYMESLGFTTIRESDEYYPSLFFIVAVSFLPLSKMTNDYAAIENYEELKRKVNELVISDEQLRQRLLKKFAKMQEENLQLTLLLALRTLSNGLDEEAYLSLIDTSEQIPSRITFAFAAALRAKSFVITQQTNNWSSLTTVQEWTWYAELVVSLQDLGIAAQFLESFILLARSQYEDVLFTFQEDDDKIEYNALSCAMLRLLAFCSQSINSVNDKCRDFICCALVTALESCKNVVMVSSRVENSKVFALFAVKLFISCAAVYNTLTAKNESITTFLEEWKLFFCEPAEQIIFCWFLALPDIIGKGIHGSSISTFTNSNNNLLVFCYYISRAIHYCSLATFEKTSLKPQCDIELDCLKYPIELQSQIVPLVSLLTSSCCHIQFASLRIFKSIMKEMFVFENKLMDEVSDSDDITKAMERKMPVVCSRLLKNAQVRGVRPSFLVLDALVSCLNEFEPIERVPYCHMLLPYLNEILLLLFDELPEIPDSSEVSFENFFPTDELSISEMITVPALVRQWYASLPRPVSAVVNTYTNEFVAPIVWKAECSKIEQTEFPSTMTVQLRSGSIMREILAVFELDDSKITLRIELPSNYPLNVPLIESEKCIVSRELQRKWILQLTMCISHQNGSIADAIVLWARNVQKHIEGVENCAICLCILNPTTYQLPKVRCKQCKNKFHGDCIRKWFESSNRLTCPLCISIFK